jgi:hypothetical protein
VKYLVLAVSLLNGLWMLIDGISVLANGKYIGPEKPGPWASLISLAGIDVFKLGPLFISFGVAWLIFVGALFSDATWARSFGVVLSIATLWYLPFGTLISVVVLAALIFFIKR